LRRYRVCAEAGNLDLMTLPLDPDALRRVPPGELKQHVLAQMDSLTKFAAVKPTDVVPEELFFTCLIIFRVVRERYGDEVVTPALAMWFSAHDRTLERLRSGELPRQSGEQAAVVSVQALYSQLSVALVRLEAAERDERKASMPEQRPRDGGNGPRRQPRRRNPYSRPEPREPWATGEQLVNLQRLGR
jgi:hypothetical protein